MATTLEPDPGNAGGGRMFMAEKIVAPGLSIQQAYMRYQNKIIFKNLSLEVPASQWTSLLGPSGVGKSTLLKLLAGILLNEDRNTTIDAYCEANIKISDGFPLKGRVAYMAQDDMLLPWYSALDNVLIGFKMRGKISDNEIRKAKHLLDLVGLNDAMHLKPFCLSGGMKQRVALARTLMEDKPIVLMDEPFSALDAAIKYNLRKLAVKLLSGRTILFVTHDPMDALCLGQNIKVMTNNPVLIKDIKNIPVCDIPRKPDTKEFLILYSQIIRELNSAEEMEFSL